MPLTTAEQQYLSTQRIGRIATASGDGEPDVAPVTFSFADDEIRIGGMAMQRTRKYHNVMSNGRASFVVDDLVSVSPWRARGLKFTGAARLAGESGRQVIHLTPETLWSWGLNESADTVFGPIEKRAYAA